MRSRKILRLRSTRRWGSIGLYVNYNDPFHRGFEYVPGGKDGVYAPIQELWI